MYSTSSLWMSNRCQLSLHNTVSWRAAETRVWPGGAVGLLVIDAVFSMGRRRGGGEKKNARRGGGAVSGQEVGVFLVFFVKIHNLVPLSI
jgi:hypothetical protein